MKRRSLNIAVCFWTITLSAIAASRAADPATANPDLQLVADGGNAFACDLYAKLRGRTGNLVFSPYGISTALAMARDGARGDTAREMAGVLHVAGAEPRRLQVGAAALQMALRGEKDQKDYELRIANRIWASDKTTILPLFLDLTERQYGARAEALSFAADPEAARRTINEWAGRQTQGKIENLVPPGSIDGQTSLVLANAVYFRARWAMPFDPADTQPAAFHVSADRRVQAPMMHRAGGFGYAETDDAKVLSIPYRGYRIAMAVVLPNRRDGLADLEAKLSPKRLDAWRKAESQWVVVSMPKFKTRTHLDLAAALKTLGMTSAFDERADFSGIDGTRTLRLSDAVHQATIDVDEHGTEAAAATAEMVAGSPENPPVFTADHPFLFFLFDEDTGAVLFLGRVVDPNA